ncbi:uncharacterized protein [Drosophila virilis]|uniref:Uncharacterized protein n=1 Tax=Drosophila virilis TaxID=7244 RepID=B4M835_DROVI|nr:uncharacterized protein LOC6633501 [Drosophila virilis]EDW62311.1 uncharacterized protein Dvir_GJ16736 [Drosophila virilis]
MSDNLKVDQPGNTAQFTIMPTSVITYGMVHKLECVQERKVTLPTPEDDGAAGEPKDQHSPVLYKWNSPCLMMVFDDGDLNSATHHLLASLHNPFAENAVATLLIQESVRDSFLERVVQRLEPLDPQIANHPNYVRSVAKLQKLKAETIVGNPKTVPANATPMLVSDIFHNFLGDGPTGIITMHTFRTPKDATQVNQKETLAYGSVSIWNEKLASPYEVCALLKNEIFMINCYNIDLAPIQPSFAAGKSDAKIVNGYHFETLTTNHKRKIIVFAVGTIFAN